MTEQQPLNITPLPLKLRVEDYLLLDASDAFADYGKTELIDGEIFFMNAQHRPHARLKSRLAVALDAALGKIASRLEMMIEPSVAMPPHSVPEPDIVLTAEPEGDGPVPLASVALLVEIADATLANDLGKKAALYAQNGVPEYWVVDVAARRVHLLWSPADSVFRERAGVAFGETITAMTIVGLRVETGSL
ncbi:Uma2 family endonuclease [Sphingomonas nostoxanthinifaciens]|uniref:Uma2 family endonuclease n=1 Tax=Sphingomonas nostoxanthinifaciens TaxID=2872652 RepID=UPI001CC218C0|nr:Uma2 family endonuclease [Sphingomonas nostoxanthinifaciens]UAK22890.1 Uma2 family endonuclease [Sphingomonas nostoxanthinifaciens]